jgi:hypothetical protein
MTEDYQNVNNVVGLNLTHLLLKDLNELLSIHGKSTKDYDLPSLPATATEENVVPSVIQRVISTHSR